MKPRPKFAVGEEVRVECSIQPEFNTTKTEVIARCWGSLKNGININSWLYQTPEFEADGVWANEEILIKLPPEQRTSWEDCIFQPTEEVICED